MISTDSALRLMRRDATVTGVLKLVMFIAAAGCVIGGGWFGWLPLAVLGGAICAWGVLGYRGVRQSSVAADSPLLIASGQYDEAEQHLEVALRSFNILRSARLVNMHQLILLRHAQGKWRDAAVLCQALLGQRLGTLKPLARSSRLLLAESLLELNDLPAAYAAITALYQQKLSLAEALNLLLVQTDYEARTGAWAAMVQNLPTKADLAELMPAHAAAKLQALLALAAKQTGRADWSTWLWRRAMLLVDPHTLLADRPALQPLMELES